MPVGYHKAIFVKMINLTYNGMPVVAREYGKDFVLNKVLIDIIQNNTKIIMIIFICLFSLYL